MVRLMGIQLPFSEVVDLFQFLYGAINGCSGNNWADDKWRFQFLYGAINGRRIFSVIGCIVLFQFLYGAINGFA